MNDKKDIAKLHSVLEADGYTDLGNIEEFTQKVQSRENSDKLHDVLEADGYTDLGNKDEFYRRLQLAPENNVSPEPVAATTVPETTDSVVVTGEGQKKAVPAAVDAADVPKAQPANNWMQRYEGYMTEGNRDGQTPFQRIHADITAEREDLSPSQSHLMATQIHSLYADKTASAIADKTVSGIPHGHGKDVGAYLEQQYYTPDTQKNIQAEADRLGLEYEDYIENHLKPQIAASLRNRFGYSELDARVIANGLYAKKGDVQNRVRTDEAIGMTSRYLGDAIDKEFAFWDEEAEKVRSDLSAPSYPTSQFGGIVQNTTDMLAARKANILNRPDNVLFNLNLHAKTIFKDLLQNEAFVKDVVEKSARLGVNPDNYIEQYVIPGFRAAIEKKFNETAVAREMPQSDLEYVIRGFDDSAAGMLFNWFMNSNDRQQMINEANALYGEKSGMFTNAARGAVGFIGDGPLWTGWGKVGGAVAKRQMAEYMVREAAKRNISVQAMERLMNESAKHYLGKAMGMRLMQGVPQMAITMGGATATGEMVRGIRDRESVGDIIENTAGTAVSEGIKGGVIGAFTGLAHPITARLNGLKKLAGKAGTFGGEASVFYAAGEIEKMLKGEEAFANPLEGIAESAVNLGMIKLSNMETFGKLLGAVAHPAKSLREAMQPERGLLSKEDVADLRSSSDGAELLDALTAMRPARTTNGEGEREGYISREEALRGAEAYERFMNDPDRPFDRKQRVARLLGGIVPPPGLEVTTEIIDRDGKKVLRTRDIDGQCVREMTFDTMEDAQTEQGKMSFDIDRNTTEALEQRVNMSDVYQNFDFYVSEEYENAADKLRSGEELSDAERTVVYLHQHRGEMLDIRNKVNDGRELTPEEQRLGDMYMNLFAEFVKRGEASKDFAKQFAEENGLSIEELQSALDGHSEKVTRQMMEGMEVGEPLEVGNGTYRTYAEQRIVDAYREAMENRVREFATQPPEGGARSEEAPLNSEERGTRSEEGVRRIEEAPQPPEGELRIEEGEVPVSADYDRGRGAVDRDDPVEIGEIGYEVNLADERVASLFSPAEKKRIHDIAKSGDEAALMQMVGRESDPVRKDAIMKLYTAAEAMRGFMDHAYEVIAGKEQQIRDEMEPHRSESGEVIAITAKDGTKGFLKSGDIRNQDGSVIVSYADENGQTQHKQVAVKDIAEVGDVMPFDDYVSARTQQLREEMESSRDDYLIGLRVGSQVDLTMSGETVPVVVEGFNEDGSVRLRDPNSEDKAIELPRDEVVSMMKATKSKRIEETLAAEAQQQRELAKQRKEEERQRRNHVEALRSEEAPQPPTAPQPPEVGEWGRLADSDVSLSDVDGVRSHLLSTYQTEDEARSAINGQRVKLRNYQRDEIQRRIDDIERSLGEYVSGKQAYSDENLRDLVAQQKDLQSQQDWLTAQARQLRDIEASLPKVYSDRKKGIEHLSPSERRMLEIEKGKTTAEKIRIAQRVYADDDAARAVFDDIDFPSDEYELVANNLGYGSLSWEGYDVDGRHIRGLQEELGKNIERGIGRGKDTNAFNSYLAAKGKGRGVDEIVHDIWESPDNQLGDGEHRYDTQEIRNALLELFMSAEKSTDIRDYSVNNRIAVAERYMQAAEEAEERMAAVVEDERWAVAYRLRPEEREVFDEYMKSVEDDFSRLSDDDIQNIYTIFAEQNQREYEEQNRGSEGLDSKHDAGGTSSEIEGGEGEVRRQGAAEDHSPTVEGEKDGRGDEVVSGDDVPRGAQLEAPQSPTAPQPPEGGGRFSERLEAAKSETSTAPTEAQKKAGNYKKGHVSFGGYNFTIENPKGSTRSGRDAKGKPWSVTMNNTYGYLTGKGHLGKDGDHLDVFINDSADLDSFGTGPGEKIYVVDQVNGDGTFDEHKIMWGFASEVDALRSYLLNYSSPWHGMGNITGVDKATFDEWVASSGRKLKPFAETRFGDSRDVVAKVMDVIAERASSDSEEGTANIEERGTRNEERVQYDKQGNPVDSDGRLIVEKVSSIEEISNDDFTSPTRNVELPKVPDNVDAALGANGKPVIIKKNIFAKNAKAHRFTPEESRQILTSALYNPDLIGRSQPKTRKNHWVAIRIDEKSPITVLEVNQSKENVEVVGWYTLDARNLERIKRQAEREDGELLILTPKGAAASLSTLPSDLSEGKGTEKVSIEQEKSEKSLSEARRLEVEGFVTETPEQAISFDRRVNDMSDEELLDYIRYQGYNENKVAHPSVYDEYDSRHGDEYVAESDAYEKMLSEAGTTREQAEEMLASVMRDWKGGGYADVADRTKLNAQMDVLNDFIERKAAEEEGARKESSVSSEVPSEEHTDADGAAASAVQSSSAKIEDFGEKIGMARKDTSVKGVKKGTGNGEPAWKKKYNLRNLSNPDGGAPAMVDVNGLVVGDADTTQPFIAYYTKKAKTRWGHDRHYPIRDKDGNVMVFRSREEFDAVVPVWEVRDQLYRIREKDGKFVISRTASNGKAVEYASFDTREEAEAYMTSPEGATSLLNHKRENFELPALESLTRVGMKDYRKGRNVTGQDMLDTFGFRGGEFGNWVNADERQQFLNTAYDALMDLANLIGVSPRALSLNGELSIAFGARGSKGARAHYEPGRAVINLTKMHGAGSLAHEWAHALDNYFGMLAKGVRREHGGDNNQYVTEYSWSSNPKIRKEVLDVFKEIKAAMERKTVTRQIDIADATEKEQKLRSSLDKAIADARAEFERGLTKYVYNRKTRKRETQKVVPTEEQLQRFDELMKALEKDSQWEYVPSKEGFRLVGSTADALYDLVKDVLPNKKGKFGPAHNVGYYMSRWKDANDYLERAKSGESETVTVDTKFMADSKRADAGRAGSYFSTVKELLARAFETYLSDKMREAGKSSDYLTYGKGDVFEQLFGINVYPSGEEAQRLSGLFDKLFSTIEERVVEDTGHIALYQKASEATPALSEQEVALRDALIDEIRQSGLEVSTDWEEGQRILDAANGRATLNRGQKRILETAPLIPKEGSMADISSIDGAKVQKNLETIAKKLEKVSSGRKNFLSEVGDAIGAKQYGSGSRYATFKAKNGTIVTIRLANHNATVSGFDYSGHNNGISIVISKRANEGIKNNGHAHLVEYFYSDKKINKAEGKPLAEIVRSIQQSLYSGEYKDTTGLAEREEVNAEQIRLQKVERPIFVSNAARAVEAIKQEKATPEQWLAMIQKNGGLKAGEDKWLGLSEWLKGSDAKTLTKQEVLDFIRENQVQVEEVEYAENVVPEEIQNKFDKYYEEESRHNHWSVAADRAWERLRDEYGDDLDIAFTLTGDNNTGFKVVVDNSEAAETLTNIPARVSNSTRLSYTTDFLENKREIALTVPTIESWNEGDEVHFGDAGEGRAVAWIRFGETTDADGKRVLVIDEIQSKRHQEGREKGYRTADAVAEEERLGDAVNEAQDAYDAYTRKMGDKYDGAYEDIYFEMTDAEQAEADRLEQEVYAASERLQNHDVSGVPDAPFEKNWHELAMKRMLRYAAENGYDKIAWTKGEQQAERYNIGDVVDKIISYDYPATKDAEGRESKKIEIRLKEGDTMTMRVNQEGRVIEGRGDTEGKQLADVVGKDLAKRIMAGEGKDGTIFDADRDLPAKVIEDDALRIGGEGMKGFYDQMLPRFMDKYGKPWGVKTQDITLPNIGDNGLSMHSVDVTPQMKESVMEGQPMFFRTEDGQAYGFTLDGKIHIDPRIATAETPIHEYGHLWAQGLRRANPEAWESLKGQLLGERDVMEYVTRRYPELEGDELMEEVFTHYGGKRGAERLRSEMEAEMAKTENWLSKAKIAAMFGKIRRALRNFWQAARDLFAGNNERLKDYSAADFADMMMNDLLSGFKPPKSSEGGDRSLMGVHNISEDKLKKAIKSGGLANPSLAVIDTRSGTHSGFGEISLIPKSSLIDASTGRNAGTYTGDAYTATYPGVSRMVTEQGRKTIERMAKEAAGGDAELERRFLSNLNDYAEGNNSARLHMLYLLQKGLNPEIKQKATKHSHEEYEELMRIFPDGDYPREMTKEQNDALLSLMMRGAEENAERQSASISDAEKRENAKRLLIAMKRSSIADENGNVWFAKGDTFFRDVMRDERTRQHPQVDWQATEVAADNRVATEGMSEDYAKWKEGLLADGDVEEQLFAGFDSDGYRQYVPNTVENASRLMNKNSDTNSYNNGGLNATRSSLLTKMTTLSEIRKNKDLLQGEEAYDEKQEEMSAELFDIIKQISDMRKISDNSFSNIDYAEARLQEAITKRDPIGYLNKEYGYDIDKKGEFAQQLNTFIEQVKRLPAKYFETKFKRPVMLDEFAVAVVPETTSPEVVKALQDAGLDVRTYDASDYKTADEKRHAVAMEAVSGRSDIMFQKVSKVDSVSGIEERGARSEVRSLATKSVMKVLDDSGVAYHEVNQDEAQRALAMANGGSMDFMTVFHGSGAKFDRFDHSHMGEGEGAQAYGYGSYVTEVEGIGRTYANEAMLRNDEPFHTRYKGQRIPQGTEGRTNFPRMAQALAYVIEIGRATTFEEAVADLMNVQEGAFRQMMDAGHDAAAEDYRRNIEALRTLRPEDFELVAAPRYLYTVEIPDEVEATYLDYTGRLGKQPDILDSVDNALAADGWKRQEIDERIQFTNGDKQIVLTPNQTGADLYAELESAFGSDKAASEFLHDVVGVTGIKYPAEYMSGGRVDGKKNYVVFNDGDLRITNRLELMRTTDGVVYGYTDGREIYLTKDGINPETPAHEYGHLWVKSVKQNRPDLWQNIKELMREDGDSQRLYKKLLGDEGYEHVHGDEDKLYEEVLCTMGGKKNRERFEQAAREVLDEATTMDETLRIANVIAKVRRAFKRLWDWIGKDLFGIKKFRSVDEVTDRMMYDFVSGAKFDSVHKRKTPSHTNLNASEGSGVQYEGVISGYKVKDLIHSTQEKDQKLLGITDENSLKFHLSKVEQEKAEIQEKAEESGTFMTAPDGTPSKLSEEDWLLARTKGFKDWIGGDWEADYPTYTSHKYDYLFGLNGEPTADAIQGYRLRPRKPRKPKQREGESSTAYFTRLRNWQKAVDEWPDTEQKWREALKEHGREDIPDEDSIRQKYREMYVSDLETWKKEHAIPSDENAPVKPDTSDMSMMDTLKAMADFRRRESVWKTAPILDDYMARAEDELSAQLANYDLRRHPLSNSAKRREIGAKLQQINAAMRRQRNYDQNTVKAVVDFAKEFMLMGYGDSLGRGEIGRLLSAVRNATGAKNVKDSIDRVMNIMLDSQLRNCENAIWKMASVKDLRQKSAASGEIDVQGKLELRGQRMIQSFRKAVSTNLSVDEIDSHMNDLLERMRGSDAESRMLESEYAGYSLARQYLTDINESKKELESLKKDRRDAEMEYGESGRTYEQQQQLLEEIDRNMLDNRIERIGYYNQLLNRLGGLINESVEGARDFVEREKERVEKIHKMANLDTSGKDPGMHRKQSWKKDWNNSSIPRFLLSSLATFEQMLKQFGSKNVNGEGYLYDYYMGGYMKASENEYLGAKKSKEALDAKVREVFDGKLKRWSDLYQLERRMDGIDVDFMDMGSGEKRTVRLTQGNALYIYMADKMSDGRMKLRKMGIDEEDVAAIKEHLDPRFVELADWLQGDFLKSRREEYNATYERLFGAPMASIENYFPLRILEGSIRKNEDVNNPNGDESILPGTTTGGIIKRTKNCLPLDILNTDAFSLAIEHIEEMEHWNAFAEFNKDINTLLSYNTFKNKVKNMNTIYGSGDILWNTFRDTAKMAAGSYRPKVGMGSVDKTITNIAKGVTAAKISFRPYTAFKQMLSAPAFLYDVDLKYFAVNSFTPWKAWNWAMENMPLFEKRYMSRQAGDTRLMANPNDWKIWKDRVVKLASQYGMTLNAFVDGVTCAVGAYSIYQSRYDKYIKMGFDETSAKTMALVDAELGYNLTQQSSEGAVVSAIQMDRTAAANGLSVFRNSSMAYTRQTVDGYRNLKRLMQKGYRDESVAFMKRQLMEKGLDEEQAQRGAEGEYKRAMRHNLAKVVVSQWILPIFWKLGPILGYILLSGDDNEEKKKAAENALVQGLVSGPVEGLAGGGIISDMVGLTMSGEGFSTEGMKGYEINPLPLFSDIQSMVGHFSYDEWAGMYDLVGIAIQSMVGVNPQTATDFVTACIDYGRGDMLDAKEIALFIMRIMNAPSATADNLYIDELGMSADDAKKLSYEELAQRYADYKFQKNATLTGWLYDEAEESKKKEKLLKQFEKKIIERIANLSDDRLYRAYQQGDAGLRKLVSKEIAERTNGGNDVIGVTTSQKEDVRKAVEYYSGNRSYSDLVGDMRLDGLRKEVEKEVDAAIDAGTVTQEQLDLVKEVAAVIKKIKYERNKMKPDGDNKKHWEAIRQKREDVLRKIERLK